MPFRFRKTFKIAKGLKINLSKSGLSTSIGGKGLSLNFGKRGARLTTGIPGTGISHSSSLTPSKKTTSAKISEAPVALYSQEPASKKTSIKLPIGCLIFVGILTLICQGMFFVSIITPPSSPTSIATLDIKKINENAMQTAWFSYTQTVIAQATHTQPSTIAFTELPTSTSTSIFTPIPATLPTSTERIIIYPTQLPTQPIVVQPPAQSSACSCGGDTLNCSDFTYHSSAQACFDYCVSQGMGDIHRLDKDGNQSACESLP